MLILPLLLLFGVWGQTRGGLTAWSAVVAAAVVVATAAAAAAAAAAAVYRWRTRNATAVAV